MLKEIRFLDKFPATIDVLLEGPLRITAESRTDYPKLEEKLIDNEEIPIPLLTYEKGLFTCVNRGAKFSRQVPGGIRAYVTQDIMTRAPVIEARDVSQALDIRNFIQENFNVLKEVAESKTRYGKVISIKSYHAGNDVYVRLAMQCGDAAGHNMTTKAATKLVKYLLERFEGSRYGSDSGNVCTDKKAAAINAITGRGKSVITEITIPREVCRELLKTIPEDIVRLNLTKNLQGSIVAGSQFSANAHYANIVAACYFATGQDIANVVEGSYGITQAKLTEKGDLYFTTTMPCLIVGTIGNGKDGESQRKSLEVMGCTKYDTPLGFNPQRLAAIIAGATAMGELSLLADQATSGRLIDAHERFER